MQEENAIENKPKTITQEDTEKILLQNGRCTIKFDEEYKVRIDMLADKDARLVAPISAIVTDLNNMPFSTNGRKKYGNDIKNIYQMVLNEQAEEAQSYAKRLKEIMERNILLERKKQYVLPATIGFVLIILISVFVWKQCHWDLFYVMMFSSLGGIIALLTQQSKIEIDYKVDESYIRFESFKRVIVTIALGIVAYVAIKSEILFKELGIFENKYIVYLIIIASAYSTNFIPNFLDKLITTDQEKINLDG